MENPSGFITQMNANNVCKLRKAMWTLYICSSISCYLDYMASTSAVSLCNRSYLLLLRCFWFNVYGTTLYLILLSSFSLIITAISDEESAKEEAMKKIKDGLEGYTNAEVVVKLGGWDATYSKTAAQASLSALKRLVLSDKNLPGASYY